MTEKKERILGAAPDLFEIEGYNATSTHKLAQKAAVSERLIFRQFNNKEGLLAAILKQGEDYAHQLLSEMVFESDSKKLPDKYFTMAESLQKQPDAFEFWKLQYKIKCETERCGEHKMEALESALSDAFKNSRYQYPSEVASLLLLLMNGLAPRLSLQKDFQAERIISHLKNTYQLLNYSS